jgi:nicotinate-nucleotide adenylyltransferase
LFPHQTAIFGGSFNPVHWGHLHVAEVALQQCQLDQVIWVPSFSPPHKLGDRLPFEHRLAMVQQAIAPYPRFTVSDIERQLGGVSFAIATFNALTQQQPQTQWSWILGIDAFLTLPQWPQWDSLVARCRWLIAPRPQPRATPPYLSQPEQPHPLDPEPAHVIHESEQKVEAIATFLAQRAIHLEWELLLLQPIQLSSSQIRQACHQAHPYQHWVPPAVYDYILAHQLYRFATG